MKFKRLKSWPPLPPLWGKQTPRGYVLWPEHVYDPDKDDPKLHKEMRKGLLAAYANKIGHSKVVGNMVFADETWGLIDLKLSREIVTLHTRGRSMGCGLWVSSQRPTYIPKTSYSQAEHLFLAYEPDKSARDRFREIGGVVNSEIIEAIVLRLKRYQWLYIRREDRYCCIVNA